MSIINCPECSKEISDAAQSCPHCGFPLKSKKINSTPDSPDGTTPPPEVRSVGLLLGIGILVLPYVFSWFTLRRGYTTMAKVIAFAWFGCIALLSTNLNGSTKDPKVAEKNMAEKRQFNENHCKSKGLIYVDKIYGKGECVTSDELVRITIENSEKLKEIEKSRANNGLR